MFAPLECDRNIRQFSSTVVRDIYACDRGVRGSHFNEAFFLPLAVNKHDQLPLPPFVMAAFFFSSPVDVDIRLEGEDKRKQVELKLEKERRESCPVYFDGESVVGQATVRVRDGKKLVHEGIKVEFVGTIGTRTFP